MMYTTTDPAYLQARAIKRKERVLAAPHNALLDAFGEVLGVRPLDFSLDAWETTVGYRQQLVGVIMERVGDCTRVGTEANGRRVAEVFIEYVARHDAAGDWTKQRVHPAVGGVFPEVIVAFWALESIEAQIANAKVDPAAIAARFEDVVSIETSGIAGSGLPFRTVWFETDAALAAARSSGVTDAITAAFVDAVREHDEFGWFGPHSVDVRFDTRQNVAENFGGQDWMYYR